MLTVLVLHVSLVAALAFTVGIACRLGRFRPAVCHALWLVVLIKLSLPPVMVWPFSLQEMLPSTSRAFIATEQAQAPPQTKPAAPLAEPSPVPPVQAAPSTPWRHVPLVFAIVWFIGGLFTLALHASRIRGFRYLLKQAQPAPDWLQQCSDELAGAFGVRPPSVLVVSGLASAVVWNPWCSKLLVSCALLNSIRRDEWSGIISHELAHLKRRDLWVGWLELAATCVWWWNPLLILVRRRLHLYGELACDAWVLWALPEGGRQYAEVLFRIVSSETQRQTPVPAFGMAAGTAAAFKARLSLLLQGGAACRIPRRAIAAIVVLLLVAVPSLTPTTEAARRVPTPIVYGSPGAPETTRDADAVLEMRVYIVRDGIQGLDSESGLPKAGNIGGLALRGLCTMISPSQITAGGLPIAMEGATLLWDGKDEPKSRDVAHVASPVLAMRADSDVSVSAAVPRQALHWLKTEKPLQIGLTCQPHGEKMRLWISLAPANASDTSTAWINLVVRAPANEWGGLVAGMGTDGKERPDLLVFWKQQPCDPSEPVQELPGPAHGEFIVRRVEKKPPSYDPELAFTAEMALIEAPAADVERIVSQLPGAAGVVTSPADVRVFRLTPKHQWRQMLEKVPDARLISAPRVTFHADAAGKRLVRHSRSKADPGMTSFEDLSPSLAEFLYAHQPNTSIVDIVQQDFPANDGKSVQKITTGTFFALATDREVKEGNLGIRLYLNSKELIRHHRGHLFWRRELAPDIVETVTTIETPYNLSEGLCFITTSLENQKLRLAFFTMTHVDSPDRQVRGASQSPS
ncbi:MAG TPA: M56 family metallopeptidase [Candidatus Hydrogenedentes bacterium]|nr:M56 family metallopeptidase [Candidatus Hydrogenedentota bacterium]HPG65310.1 M56 family metallopeptidase [Candidatus Hydrogenedentota bacterium]